MAFTGVGGTADDYAKVKYQVDPPRQPRRGGSHRVSGIGDYAKEQMESGITSKVEPVNVPERGAMPEFAAPGYDDREVRKLTQKHAAPGTRKLREAVQIAMSRDYDNPNVKRLHLRDALSGYGSGLESVMAGAGRAATAEYGERYGIEHDAAVKRYSAEMQGREEKYEDDLLREKLRYGHEKENEDELERLFEESGGPTGPSRFSGGARPGFYGFQ